MLTRLCLRRFVGAAAQHPGPGSGVSFPVPSERPGKCLPHRRPGHRRSHRTRSVEGGLGGSSQERQAPARSQTRRPGFAHLTGRTGEVVENGGEDKVRGPGRLAPLHLSSPLPPVAPRHS